MKKLLHEFKEFAFRGNVIDLAVGVVIGSAFTGIVTSIVNDLITPIIAFLTGSVDFSALVIRLSDGGKRPDHRRGLVHPDGGELLHHRAVHLLSGQGHQQPARSEARQADRAGEEATPVPLLQERNRR